MILFTTSTAPLLGPIVTQPLVVGARYLGSSADQALDPVFALMSQSVRAALAHLVIAAVIALAVLAGALVSSSVASPAIAVSWRRRACLGNPDDKTILARSDEKLEDEAVVRISPRSRHKGRLVESFELSRDEAFEVCELLAEAERQFTNRDLISQAHRASVMFEIFEERLFLAGPRASSVSNPKNGLSSRGTKPSRRRVCSGGLELNGE